MSTTFNQSSSGAFYLLSNPIALSPYCIAFLPSRAESVDRTLSLGETWTDVPGVYLFLNSDSDKLVPAELEPALRELLNQPEFNQVRFLWVENPVDPLALWRVSFLAVEPSTQTIDRVTRFDFRHLSLVIARKSRIALNDAKDGFVITRAADNAEGFSLDVDGAQLLGVGSPIALPLQGNQAGCLQFDLTLQRPISGAYTELSLLKIGLRLFFKDPNFPSSDDDFTVAARHYPLFATQPTELPFYNSDLRLYVTLDVLHLLNGDRTYFGFVSADGKKATAIPSCYRTNLGYTIHLTPHDTQCRLVFAIEPSSKQLGAAAPLYLVPSGDFEMTVPRRQAGASQNPAEYDDNLVCGISGLEYIKLSKNADQRTLLCFKPGFNAFVPAFAPGETPTIPTQDAGLTDLATTAWAYVRHTEATAPTIYYAQPDQSVLYKPNLQPTQTAIAITPKNLFYMEVPSSGLPSAPTEQAFPLLPYGGVDRTLLKEYKQLEAQVISPLRRSQVHQLSDRAIPLGSQADRDRPVTGTTSQGLLATFSGDYETLRELILAKDSTNQTLRLQGIGRDSILRTALQSNQLFLVIANPATLRPFFTDPQKKDRKLTIAGWTFNLDPDSWATYQTLLVFKFHDQPLSDLAQNLSTWTLPGEFVKQANDSEEVAQRRLTEVQQQLTNLIGDALAKDTESANLKDRENYAALSLAARTPGWTGIFAFRVAVPPTSFPPELQALSAGIDDKKFFAQYFGIETTPVTAIGATLDVKPSSLFGLIDYNDDAIPTPNDTGYNFHVTQLRVLFQNSLLKNFSSEVAVTLDKLFDEKTQLLNSTTGRNVLILKGSAENHDGRTTYAFSFTGDNRFATPDSRVLNEVEIIKAQFATDPIANGTITGRFTFWGRLNFRRLPKFDLFSFGVEDEMSEENKKFLTFSNLIVTMSFPQNMPQHRSFAFLPGSLAFDPQRSAVRDESLFAKFPLKLTGLTYSPGDTAIDSLGYMPVKSPLGSAKPADTDTWYGLTFDLELGSLGALAGKAGLVASILAAWTPGEDGIFVGLRLPGSTGGKREIKIQGVIKIVFKSIQFVVGEKNGKATYLLKLKNILLKVLILSLPPSAQTEITIFGNPDGTVNDRTVGWYAAYTKELPPPPPPPQPILPASKL